MLWWICCDATDATSSNGMEGLDRETASGRTFQYRLLGNNSHHGIPHLDTTIRDRALADHRHRRRVATAAVIDLTSSKATSCWSSRWTQGSHVDSRRSKTCVRHGPRRLVEKDAGVPALERLDPTTKFDAPHIHHYAVPLYPSSTPRTGSSRSSSGILLLTSLGSRILTSHPSHSLRTRRFVNAVAGPGGKRRMNPNGEK